MARPSKNIAVAHALWLDAGQAAICEFCGDRSGNLILAVFSFLSKVNGLETRLFSRWEIASSGGGGAGKSVEIDFDSKKRLAEVGIRWRIGLRFNDG